MLTVRRGKPCKFCTKGGFDDESLGIHIRVDHPDGFLTCDEITCGKPFYSYGALMLHQLYHKKRQTTFPCNLCDKIFRKKKELSLHVKSNHSNQRSLKCLKCPKMFLTKNTLKKHLITHLNQEGRRKNEIIPKHECYFCAKIFPDSFALDTHMPKHTMERRFNCEYCNKNYKYSSILSKHRSTHFKGKFRCEVCNKIFSAKNHLLLHKSKGHVKFKETDQIFEDKSFEEDYVIHEVSMDNHQYFQNLEKCLKKKPVFIQTKLKLVQRKLPLPLEKQNEQTATLLNSDPEISASNRSLQNSYELQRNQMDNIESAQTINERFVSRFTNVVIPIQEYINTTIDDLEILSLY